MRGRGFTASHCAGEGRGMVAGWQGGRVAGWQSGRVAGWRALCGNVVKVGVSLLIVVEQHEGGARLEAGHVGVKDVPRLLHHLAHREEDIRRYVRA